MTFDYAGEGPGRIMMCCTTVALVAGCSMQDQSEHKTEIISTLSDKMSGNQIKKRLKGKPIFTSRMGSQNIFSV